MNRFRHETGQAAVLTVMFMAALLGTVAMVLDVGSWFRAQRATQSAADAAALAAAQGLPGDTGLASALGSEYLAANGGGAGEYTFSKKAFDNDTITVEVTRQADGFFAKLFGIDTVDVHGKASARAGGMTAAKWVAPIVVNVAPRSELRRLQRQARSVLRQADPGRPRPPAQAGRRRRGRRVRADQPEQG
jgi:uncharacterized membrane protein